MNPPPKQRRKSCKKNEVSSSACHQSGSSRPVSNLHQNKAEGCTRQNRNRKRRRRRKRPGVTNNKQPHNSGTQYSDPEIAKSCDSASTTSQESQVKLHWLDPSSHYIPISEEERMLPLLLHWGKNERGMMKDQPEFRLRRILKQLGIKRSNKRQNSHDKCDKIQISLIQSLSLRRHHLKLLNPKLPMPALRLGSNSDFKKSADLFEQCVEQHLKTMGVPFWNEMDQRRMYEESGARRQPLTPDFKIKDGYSVQLLLENNQQPQIVNWIEAKMFYGASTIPHTTRNAVGSILPKARLYVQYYGPGAIVFMYGCGVELARDLRQIGVVALDCRGLDLERVVKYQLVWCGDANGDVLF